MESSFEYQFDPYIIVFNCEGINCYTFLPNYFLWGKKKRPKKQPFSKATASKPMISIVLG